MAKERPIVSQLHVWLGVVSGLIVAAVALESAWRAWRQIPPGPLAACHDERQEQCAVEPSGGGLGLVVAGASPREPLHYVYAVVALGILPLVTSLSRRLAPGRRGVATFLGALVALVVIIRLFGTG